MTDPPPSDAVGDLSDRLERLGRSLGAREAAHAADLDVARAVALALRARVEAALERFHVAAAEAGAPQLRIDLSGVRINDKHLRAVEFDLSRGRHRAVVTAKSHGKVTLVGPYHAGKEEGPCVSLPFAAESEIVDALANLLEAFAREAATP